MKVTLCILLLCLSVEVHHSLKLDEYTQSIDDLLLDPQFLSDYMKWSWKLFSTPDYLHGKAHDDFPCPLDRSIVSPDNLTVHELRPNDVQCVAAIGDSLTAALGAHALTPVGLFTENRGVSWSIGGDYSFKTLVTLPNILREYNPKLQGFSTKNSLIFGKGQNSSHNGFNVAKSGDRSYHTIDQVQILHQRLRSEELCHWEKDWKVITLFIGGNDLCIFCEDLNKHSPSNYTFYVQQTLDYLHSYFPRTFVNLVLVLDVRDVEKLNAGGNVCKLLHKRTCPCAAFPSDDDRRTLAEWIPMYQQSLLDLVNSGRYETRDDFTVVVQPFMAHTPLPLVDGQIDYSYFAPDCFHFSGKGHSRASLSLWNNMLEPVGEKSWEWHAGEDFKCPSEQRPYFATRMNSAQSREKVPADKSPL